MTYCKECGDEWTIYAEVISHVPIRAGGEYIWKDTEYVETLMYHCSECGASSPEYTDIAGGEYA